MVGDERTEDRRRKTDGAGSLVFSEGFGFVYQGTEHAAYFPAGAHELFVKSSRKIPASDLSNCITPLKKLDIVN